MPSLPVGRRAILLAAAAVAACERPAMEGSAGKQDTALVYVAASLTNALRPQLDSFGAARHVTVLAESGASLEQARKLSELHRIPDLILLADDEVFPKELAPNYTPWWADFARNRMVVAYTGKSKGANDISAANWYQVLTRPGVEVGRADPTIAPVGYRTLTLFTLAALRYRQPDLARKLAENAPEKNVRPNAAELAALLAAGELDYIYDYESVAQAQQFRYVVLPPEITGVPVTYALAIPAAAPHPKAAGQLLEFFLSDSTKAKLRARYVDMLARPVVHGTGAPAFLTGTP
jgi:molybdate/tungstate transport system substrate-binding protein